MRFPSYVHVPESLTSTVVPAELSEPTAPQRVQEAEPSRLMAWLDQLDPDQRVRAIGEW